MNPTIYRCPSTPQGTFGAWFIENKPFCVSLERPDKGDHPCVPTGTYQCNWFNSPHNGWCYLIKDFGDRMIEIHPANRYTDLLGCIAPGRRFGVIEGVPAVLESGAALNDLHKVLGDSFTLTIEDV